MPTSTDRGNYSPSEDRHTAISMLDRAIDEGAVEMKDELAEATRAIVRLREHFIVQSRQGSVVAHDALNNANMALSLILSVEYPSIAINRKFLEQARDCLSKLST